MKIGDKVKTEKGDGTIVHIDPNDGVCLVSIPGFCGHNGLQKKTRYVHWEANCYWFSPETLTLIWTPKNGEVVQVKDSHMEEFSTETYRFVGMAVGGEFVCEDNDEVGGCYERWGQCRPVSTKRTLTLEVTEEQYQELSKQFKEV